MRRPFDGHTPFPNAEMSVSTSRKLPENCEFAFTQNKSTSVLACTNRHNATNKTLVHGMHAPLHGTALGGWCTLGLVTRWVVNDAHPVSVRWG